MPPKAAAKVQAQAKAKRPYSKRLFSVPAPAPVRARNEQRQIAFRARPGAWRQCPQCGYPRYVPDHETRTYTCAMPRVRLPSGEWFKCTFKTLTRDWRRRARSSLEHETACKATITDLVISVDARCEAGDVDDADFLPTVQREMAERVAAAMQPAPPPPVPE